MAHFASELDYKRILKNSSRYYLEPDYIKQVYKSGFMVISDLDFLSFAYPVEYFDGILIRYYTKDSKEELLDIVSFLSLRMKGKLFLPHIAEENRAAFTALGFKSFYKISGLYKTDYNTSLKSFPCSFEDFSQDTLKELEELSQNLFPYNWRLTLNDLSALSLDRNIRIRLCCSEGDLLGFIILRIDKTLNYGYITKLAVKKDFQRRGIGTLLINDSVRFFKDNDMLPVFTDAVTDEAVGFFQYNGFKVYSNSYLLVRENFISDKLN